MQNQEWETNKQSVIDNLEWDDRVMKHIVTNDLFEIIEQKVEDRKNLKTTIKVKEFTVTLEDVFIVNPIASLDK